MSKFIILVLLFSITSVAYAVNGKWLQAKTDDNMSMMQYASENHERLAKKAIKNYVNQDYTFWSALYVYHMPDGKIVRCERGILEGTFIYNCKELPQ